MNQYFSKTFNANEPGDIDGWLNSFRSPGLGVRVVGYVHFRSPMPMVLITVVVFKLGQTPATASPDKPLTIDAIPEDPAIDYDTV